MNLKESILKFQILGNSIENLLWAAIILLFVLFFKKLISKLLTRLLYSTFGPKMKEIGIDKFVNLLHHPFSFLFLLSGVYYSCSFLYFPPSWNLEPIENFGLRMVLQRFYSVFLIIGIFWLLLRFLDYMALLYGARAAKTTSQTDDQFVHFAHEIIKVFIGLTGLVVAIAIGLDLDLVSLITGLGIGGLAFALAAKETLENLLGSFTIFLDKPFVVGDHIKVGNIDGVVESIGIRTTRVRSMDKSLVNVPNKKMIDAELINENSRKLRRVKILLGLTYNTDAQKLKGIITDIKELLKKDSDIEDNYLVHFRDFNSSSVDIFVRYFIRHPEFEKYLEVNERVNFEIMNIVKTHEAEFAFPTTTVVMNNKS